MNEYNYDRVNKETDIEEAMKEVLRLLREAKPNERSDWARRYAVTIAKMETTLGYFKTFVIDGYWV